MTFGTPVTVAVPPVEMAMLVSVRMPALALSRGPHASAPLVAGGRTGRAGGRAGYGRVGREGGERPRAVLPGAPLFQHPRLGHAKRGQDATRVFSHALLLRAGEEGTGDEGAHDHQGDDCQGERHAALVLQDPLHRTLLRVHRWCERQRHGPHRGLFRTATRVVTVSVL